MIEFEADDALATAARRFSESTRVEQVVLCSPDKDLAQCVSGQNIVCLDRMRRRVLDENGVILKFGVPPGSIPDWLALVGDAADGLPGIPRWGAKSASAVLARYQVLESIPGRADEWDVTVRGAKALAETLEAGSESALLYRELARLRFDVPLAETLDDLCWLGAHEGALGNLPDPDADLWRTRARTLARQKA
jgi:5'-3' exonuclease